ncbi:hypothetical protein M413DRAFT_438667 [Hebeloma cylindrosporum]|uniref:Uncharacterized protein n=1 Tax=Hebeloma cylindrosporum TaxID=76867 RepID=A0A0C3CZ95_HEBCY|nr:hypothetical protein M413DRAFT_438667 [Hebeloma cylindrosporum h7]
MIDILQLDQLFKESDEEDAMDAGLATSQGPPCLLRRSKIMHILDNPSSADLEPTVFEHV